MKVFPHFWQQEARQGPAVTVTPVFTPKKPFLRNNLLVLSHKTSFLIPSLVIQTLQFFVPTTFRKNGMVRHLAIIKARSYGLELLRKLGSPCEFPKQDCFIYKVFALEFIRAMNAFIGGVSQGFEVINPPAHLAKATAASFPLGSISPYMSCSTVMTSPAINQAEVPVISPASSSITTNCSPIRMPFC